MKHGAMVSLMVVTLACGGAPKQSTPMLDEPAAPPPVEGTVAASDGVPIAYTVRGEGSPALVFIHGWMCNQTFWDAQVGPLSETNTVVTLDLPGHGVSPTNRDDWTLASFGSDVHTVVEHLGLDQVILIGHSMGGPVALEAARLMPDRVIGVVAVDALQNADFVIDPDRAVEYLSRWEQDFAGTCDGFVTSLFPETADPRLVERVKAAMCGANPEASIAQLREFFQYDMKTALESVQVPVRCINSSAIPTNVEGNRAYHEDFDVVVMDGVGHFLMMEAPERFNAHLGLVVAELSETLKR